MGGFKVTIEGKDYWQPECNCKGAGHICYVRSMPTTIDVPIEKILSRTPSTIKNLRDKDKA